LQQARMPPRFPLQPLFAIPILALVSNQLFTLSRVPEFPCVNDLAEGDVVLTLRAHQYKPGDVVAFPSPTDGRHGPSRIKRISATPGAWVKRKDGKGYIHVPRGHVFCTNDADVPLCESGDGYEHGPIPQALLTGRIAAVVFPLRRARVIPSRPPPPNDMLGRQRPYSDVDA
jgi:hypothetical protein